MRKITKTYTLFDSDGDGILKIQWDNKHPGTTIQVMDIFDNVTLGEFYKKDLLKYLKNVVIKLESEII